MNKNQKDIVHAKLYEKYQIAETPQNYRLVIQPLPELNRDVELIKANRTKLVNETKEDKQILNEYKIKQALDTYNAIKNRLPNDLSILKPKTQKKYSSINNAIKKYAIEGNTNAQSLIIEQYIDKLNPLCNAPEFLEKIQFQQCLHAYEFLDFTATVKSNNIPVATTDSQGKQLIDIRNQTNKTNPSASYIIQSIYYLQSITENERKFRYSKLSNMKPETAETEIICQFLINYGDDTLSPQAVAKKFIQAINTCENDTKSIIQTIEHCANGTVSPQDVTIQLIQTIKAQKKSADILSAIAKSPLFPHVIQKLNNAILNSTNKQLVSDINYIVAELYYSKLDYSQADSYYRKNKPAFLKEKKVQYHAFNANIATSQSFNKEDINYLSSLVGNTYNQLKKIDTTNPELSYKVGLLIHALVNNTPAMNIAEKIEMLHDALRHIENTHKDAATCITLHTTLSTIYTQKNDHISALKHTTSALQLHDSNSQEYAIANILDNAEKNSCDFYKQHVQSIQCIINFINNGVADSTKNCNLPSEFILSDLWQQLLPYCDATYAKNKNANNDILYAMALSHTESGNYDTACTYIDVLPQPLSKTAQLLKARIYTATQKTLSDEELEAIFKTFVHNKKTSSTDQETTVSLLTQSDRSEQLLAQPKNHDLAIKLITKLSDTSTSHAAILLAFNITKHLKTTQSSTTQQWQEKLKSCNQFYTNIAAPSEYNGYTNFAAGLLLMESGITYSSRIISYFIAALNSKEVLPKSAEAAQKAIAALYNEWALAIHDDFNTRLALFDEALQYNNNSAIRFNKASAILVDSDDQDLINDALQLLEENSTQDCPERTFSQLALAQVYCNYSPDAARLPILKKLIPLDINKAIACLQNHNNQPELLKRLISIYAGESIWIPKQLAEPYINLEQALHYINVLIDTDKYKIDYISLRMELYVKLHHIDNAIADIDLMLNAQNLSNTRGVTKEKLLFRKSELLLQKEPHEELYNQILECAQQLKTYDERDVILFNMSPLIKERTKYLVDNTIMTDSAIEWCCFAVNSCVAANNCRESDVTQLLSADLLLREPTQEQKDLAHYILSAAKADNLDAQLIALPYLNAIGYVTQSNFTESLRYSHQALCNPKSRQKEANVTFLIELLQSYIVKEGVILAYYILCDYYKNYPKKIEKRMLFLNQAKKYERPDESATDLIETIFTSCKHVFSKSVELCVKNQKNLNKLTLTDAIASFTYGSMCQYSNKKDTLTSAILSLDIAQKLLCEKFKLQQYRSPLHFFLGSAYYKLAILNEKIDYELLRKSAQTEYIPPLHKMAEIYIEQHENGKHDIPVKTIDFMPLLAKDLNYPLSRELFKKCADITTLQEKREVSDDSDDKPVLVKFTGNSTDLTALLEASATYVTSNTEIKEKTGIDLTSIPDRQIHKKNQDLATIVKDLNNTECPPEIIDAMINFEKGNKAAALKVIRNAAAKHKIPSAYMLLASNYLQGDGVKQNYALSQEYLEEAFKYGLVGNQLCNGHFFGTVCTYLSDLTLKHLPSMQQHLLRIITQALTDHGVDITTFYVLVKEYTKLDVSLHTEKKDVAPFIKNHNYQETSSAFLAGLQAYQHKDRKKAFEYMYKAAIDEHHPSACLYASYHYYIGDMVKKNNKQSNVLLLEALADGLITGQFCSPQFLEELVAYTKEILKNKNDNTAYSLQIIKSALTVQGIDPSYFCNIYKEYTDTDLASVPEWSETDTNTTNTNAPVQPQLSITDLQKKMVKDHTNRLSDDFKQALTDALKKDMTKMTIAADKNDSCACIIMALHNFTGEGVKKCLYLSGAYIKEALKYGLIEQQFCNNLFLKKLCSYIKTIISAEYAPDDILFKKQLLHKIKKYLLINNIDLTDFCTIMLNETQIDLLTCLEWIESDKNYKFTEQKKLLLRIDAIKNDSAVDNCLQKAVINLLTNMTTKQENQPKNKLFQQRRPKNSLAFAAVEDAAVEGNIKKCMELAKTVAEIEHHPRAYMVLAFEHVRGTFLDKNIDASKQFLINALFYGLIEQQFCDGEFMEDLCDYINFVIKAKYSKNNKQTLLLTIKKALEAKSIDLNAFYDEFKKQHKIDLSKVAEWNI